mgnify:CR=1 FL=1
MTNSRSYYFAYGSNLSKEQMFSRCPESDYLMPGKLLDYSWLITKRGYASVKPSTEDLVLGEIFSLNQQDIEYLDVTIFIDYSIKLHLIKSAIDGIISTLFPALDCIDCIKYKSVDIEKLFEKKGQNTERQHPFF